MNVFDSHLHIIDPRFPLTPNQGYVPEPFTCSDYLARAKPLGIVGGAVVSGSFQGFDQSYLLAALESLGPSFVGVTRVPATATDEEIRTLDKAGVRAVRFNLKRGVSPDLSDLSSMAQRVCEVAGWHVEFYVDGADLPGLLNQLLALPKVVIDHLGLSSAGLPSLYKLVERGAYVKATGFGRLDFDPVLAIRHIAKINPNALLFGTDLPSTRAPRLFQEQDVRLIQETLEPNLVRRVLYENAISLYRPAGLVRDTN